MRTIEVSRRPSLLDGVPRAQARVVFNNFAEEAAFLRRMVNEYAGDARLREITIRVLFPATRPKDEPAQALRIGKWVQDRINYVHDPRPWVAQIGKKRIAQTELFQSPLTTLRLGAGDCDKYTVLIASMLQSVGIRNKLCILKINGKWAHIFPVALVVDAGRLHRLTLDGTLVERDNDPPYEPTNDPISDLVNPIAVVKARGDDVEPYFV